MSSSRPSSWPPRYGASELGRLLSTPYAAEDLSPLGGPGVLLLDLSVTPESEALQWCSRLLAELPVLPCITIAIEAQTQNRVVPEAGGTSAKRTLARACDVALLENDDLGGLLSGFKPTPIAALAYVQLLRRSPWTSIYAGLIAESFVYSTLQSGAEFKAWLTARAGGREKQRFFRRRRDRKKLESRPTSQPPCRFERDEGRLALTLNRPLKHNAFSREMRDGLVEGLHLAISDASIEEVVLRGVGASFCSGGDLDEFGSAGDPARAHMIRTTRSPADCIARLNGRIRAEVQGACLGAGVELPAFTDHVIASEDAFFQLPEVAMGLIPGAGGTVSLPRRIGRQRTAWLGLSGDRIDAEKALAWGLVDEVRLGQHVVADSSVKSG